MGAVFTLLYMYFNYTKIQDLTRDTLNTESINSALLVSKKLSELNDKIAITYEKYETGIYASLQKSHNYLEKNGRYASLEVLKKELNAHTKEEVYDVYLINKDYIIESTTFQQDMHLDFHIIPESVKVLRKVFKNPSYIDLSAPMYERITSEYKRYIVQKSTDGNYLIQVSIKVNYTKEIKKYVENLKTQMPKLLASKVIFIYPKDETAYLVDLLSYENFKSDISKNESFRKNNIYNELPLLFDPKNTLTKQEFQKELEYFLSEGTYKDYYITKEGKYIHRVILPFFSYLNAAEGSLFAISIEFDETAALKELEGVAYFSMLIYIFMFILAAMAYFYVSRYVIEPVSKLQVLMKEKKEVDLTTLHSTKDEIGSMSLVYNQLLRDIKREIQTNEELLEEFKNFTANSIHQVRTPVSVIKIALEMIESPNKEAMNQIKSSLVSIEHLYNTLSFTLTQDKVAFKKEELNLSNLLFTRVNMFQVVAASNDKKILLDVKPGVMVSMSLVELEFLIDNNISNAIKHSDRMSEIHVKLVESENEISLVFQSNGAHIEDTKVIFERYYKANGSRNGNGIGLHMVDTICRKNNILIHVDSYSNINRFIYYFEKM